MSVLIVARVTGDTAAFQKGMANRGDEFEAIANRAKGSGAMRHRFGIGEGFVLVVDEWDTADHFQQFFSDPELQAFVDSVGLSTGEPEVLVAEAITSPDQF